MISRKKYPLRQQCIELKKLGYPQDMGERAWGSHKFLGLSERWIPLWHADRYPNPFFQMGAKEPDGYESIACPIVTEMVYVLSKFEYQCRVQPAFKIEYSGIWWECKYEEPINFTNPMIRGATVTIACADMMVFLLEKKLISSAKIRKLLSNIASDNYKKEPPISYELECPECRTTFEVDVKVVGPEPFLTICPDCDTEVSSDFIFKSIY